MSEGINFKGSLGGTHFVTMAGTDFGTMMGEWSLFGFRVLLDRDPRDNEVRIWSMYFASNWKSNSCFTWSQRKSQRGKVNGKKSTTKKSMPKFFGSETVNSKSCKLHSQHYK